mmetsp:Transcript_94917/g.268031  ORF Transcript_94917/g.268031 Transcript_94917/m.268031 type:complete len:202 (+) Transcript_94917:1768-2373(+)
MSKRVAAVAHCREWAPPDFQVAGGRALRGVCQRQGLHAFAAQPLRGPHEVGKTTVRGLQGSGRHCVADKAAALREGVHARGRHVRRPGGLKRTRPPRVAHSPAARGHIGKDRTSLSGRRREVRGGRAVRQPGGQHGDDRRRWGIPPRQFLALPDIVRAVDVCAQPLVRSDGCRAGWAPRGRGGGRGRRRRDRGGGRGGDVG